MNQATTILTCSEVSQAEAARMGAFRENALTEADAMAAADQEGTKV